MAVEEATPTGDLPTDLQLTGAERRVVSRLLDWLRAEVDDDLLAVWLFGSRARGEADLAETDPDRRSDVDLMVVVDGDRDSSALDWQISPQLAAIADDEGESPVWFSVLVYDVDRLRRRREIESFFVAEVDRDKIVLAGSGLEAAADR